LKNKSKICSGIGCIQQVSVTAHISCLQVLLSNVLSKRITSKAVWPLRLAKITPPDLQWEVQHVQTVLKFS
jgi:hypothetical protein